MILDNVSILCWLEKERRDRFQADFRELFIFFPRNFSIHWSHLESHMLLHPATFNLTLKDQNNAHCRKEEIRLEQKLIEDQSKYILDFTFMNSFTYPSAWEQFMKQGTSSLQLNLKGKFSCKNSYLITLLLLLYLLRRRCSKASKNSNIGDKIYFIEECHCCKPGKDQ